MERSRALRTGDLHMPGYVPAMRCYGSYIAEPGFADECIQYKEQIDTTKSFKTVYKWRYAGLYRNRPWLCDQKNSRNLRSLEGMRGHRRSVGGGLGRMISVRQMSRPCDVVTSPISFAVR